ncbi:hybrid sensor histidine kinase/response regulator transcription factor [Spirosoma litoris]
MKTVSFVLSILLWLVTYTPTEAQPYVAWVNHYGPENGLAHREVNAIFQDQQGFMWFGTKFGLSRFDGKTFTTYTKERNGLTFDDIHAITQDAEGRLWLGGPNGQSQICVFNPQTTQAISFTELVRKKQPFLTSFSNLQSPWSDPNGTIFLTNYQPASLLSYHPASGLHAIALPQFKTLAIFRVTAHHTVWAVADEHRIVELTADGRILHQFTHEQDIVSWCFGQRNVGIEFFYTVYNPANKGSRQFYSVDEFGHRRTWPPALLESMKRYTGPICYPVDRTWVLWDGISLRDSTNRILLTIADQTHGETIENRSFYRDRNGQFWLGTSFGVYQVKLTQNHFHRLVYQSTNKGDQVAAIRGISVLDDQVFVNLEKFGLYSVSRLGGAATKLYTHSVFAYGLTQDRQGKLYAGNGNQIVQFDRLANRFSIIRLPDASTCWAFYPIGLTHWLVGTQTGLMLVSTQTAKVSPFTRYNQFKELAQGHILHIAPDRQGRLWICATTGLYTIDPSQGVTARYWSGGKNGTYLPADSYQHIYQDTTGIYWLATANSGLIRWDRTKNQYRQFRRSEGLANDNIYAIYPDRQGNLWLSSDYGIMRFDPTRLTTRTYFVQDGITHNEFNRIAHFQDKAGRIYFGGLNGITWFDPQDFDAEPHSAPLSIQVVAFRQFDSSTNQLADKTGELVQTHRIVIRPGDQTAILDFALLNFTDAEKNVYAYQFKGLDTQWTQQTESSLRLGNLPYGTYQLLIKGQASNGQWSDNTLTIQVDIQRPFYLQTWFLALAVGILVIGLWAWLKWRIWNHQQEQKRLQNQIQQATAQIEEDKQLIEQQAQALHQLNEAKSRFFANISHEFRTPLTVILGMAATINQKVTGEQSLNIRQSTDLIERNGRSLLRLINQILDLSKLEAGEMQWQPVHADLIQFVRYLAESFHTMATFRHIQLHFQADQDVLLTDFDPDKLQDVLSNLLTNALKFTPQNGQVFLQLATEKNRPTREEYVNVVSPNREPAENWFFIHIRDTGPGIDPALLPLIFDRFFQADSPQIADLSGTGIGLSLVRELVELMQGGLSVRSVPGQGTEFIIQLRQTHAATIASLPLDKPGNSFVPPDMVELVDEMPDEKPILLLVEDNADVAQYITTCIGADYRISRADNGQTGIDLALEQMPDLILSDVMMPQKDGFALCDTLKNDSRTSHIPIVLLTARAAVSDRISGLRRGADAYLTKPFQQEELKVVLGNLLNTRRQLQLHYSQQTLDSASSSLAETDDSLEDQFLRKLKLALAPQLNQSQLSIEVLCQEMGMSRTSLHRKITALTGMSLTKYIRSLRLARAKELLWSSELNISEVAYAVGFDDPKYFSRVFSEEFGVSPANFRLLEQ